MNLCGRLLFSFFLFFSSSLMAEDILHSKDSEKCLSKECESQFTKIQRFALNGSPRAQYILGLMYREGNSVEKNFKKSYRWLKKSSAANFTPAYFELAVAYREGIGTDIDLDRYSKYLDKAIKKGSLKAAFMRSNTILKEAVQAQGSYSDLQRSELRRKSIDLLESFDKRPPEVDFLLGLAYENGLLVETDTGKAKKLYLRAAERKHPKALKRLKGLIPDIELNNSGIPVSDNHVLIETDRPDIASMLQYNVELIRGQKLYGNVKTGSRIRPCHQTPGCSSTIISELNEELLYSDMQ